MLLFSCYYSSISLFSHAHIVGGVSVVHSHFGGDSDHNHSDSQYAVIDILSQFQSESAAGTASGLKYLPTPEIKYQITNQKPEDEKNNFSFGGGVVYCTAFCRSKRY